MSNKTQLQTNNASLNDYIIRINAAKEVAANLPEADGGGTPTPTQEKIVAITENGTVKVTPDEGYALSKVTATVNVPIPDGYIKPSGTKEITENGTHDAKAYESVNVNVPIPEGYIKPSGTLEVTENGTFDVTDKASVNVNVPTGGGGSNNYAKFTAATDSSISFVIENPLGGFAKKVSIKAISPTITSSRKIHECCLDWDVRLGAVKAYYSSGNVSYVMGGTESTPNNGQFRMTEGFITVYRFNSATTWDTTCEYEVEVYQ